MSISNAIAGLPIKNNGGVGFASGSSSSVLVSVEAGSPVSPVGSSVVDGVNATSALLAGIFANNSSVPVAKRISDSLGGVANDFLVSGAGKPDLIKNPLKIEEITTTRTATALRAGYWNDVTGSWSVNPTTATDSFGTDNAATLTREDPGTLTYTLGNSSSPVTAGYASKTN